MNTRTKHVCFTFNNYTDDDYVAIKLMLQSKADYAVIGEEIGESGTPHLQGYFELPTRYNRLSTICNWFEAATGKRPHVEKRNGPRHAAADYCKKDGTFWEHGSLPQGKQGKRTDIEQVRDAIIDGTVKSEWDLMNNCTSMSAYRFGSMFLNNMPTSASHDPPKVFWLFGSTGSGKSRASADFVDHVAEARKWTFWRANHGLDWFDGYNMQEIAWFDDFRFSGRQKDYSHLLNLTDRYSFRVPIKGGFVRWQPRIIIFTGPVSIDTAFLGLPDRDGVDQFKRRITAEYDFDAGGKEEFRSSIERFLGGRESQHPARADPVVPLDVDAPREPPALVRAEHEHEEEDAMSIAATVAYSIDSDIDDYIDHENWSGDFIDLTK